MKNTAIVLLFLASFATPTFAAGTDMHQFVINSMFGKISRTAGWFAFFQTTKRKTKTFLRSFRIGRSSGRRLRYSLILSAG